MSAFVLHDQGEAKSIATGSPPNPVPNGWSAVVITDAEFAGLTSGTHRWDTPTRTVVVDSAKAQQATNLQTIRDGVTAALATMQAIIDTAQISFTTVAQAQTAMRGLQAQVKDEARVLRRLIRLAVEDYTGTD